MAKNMVCCKSKEFDGWCKDFPTYYTDPVSRERAEYCLFHAPFDEAKWGTIATFNDKIHSLIRNAIEAGKECNLSGAVFPGDIDFRKGGRPDSQGNFTLPPINLTRAAFFGVADFGDITFSGDVYLNGVTFLGGVSFNKTTFQGSTYFKGATFTKDVFFIGANFKERVHFSDNTNFFEEADFGGAIFAGDVGFERVSFLKKANFNHASFSGDVSFFETSFQDVIFEETRFKCGAVFEEGQNEMFNGSVRFSRVAAWDKKIFFRKINLAKGFVSFLDTDLTRFRFERCAWPQLDGLFMNPEDKDALYDEIKANQDFSAAAWRTRLSDNDLLERYGMVEELYRQMKQQAKERHNEPEASKWHYREKEMFRKKNLLRRYNPLSVTNLYWICSGYGERPVWAGFVLLLLFVAIGFVMNGLGLHADGNEVIQGFSLSPPDWTKIGKISQSVIEHALFVKDPVLKAQAGWSGVLFTFWTKLLIPVQAALFAFALRNKFRR